MKRRANAPIQSNSQAVLLVKLQVYQQLSTILHVQRPLLSRYFVFLTKGNIGFAKHYLTTDLSLAIKRSHVQKVKAISYAQRAARGEVEGLLCGRGRTGHGIDANGKRLLCG